MADSTLVSGLATAGATLVAGAFVLVGRRKNNADPNASQAVSLTKQLMSDQRRDLDRCRRRVAKLERDLDDARDEAEAEKVRHHSVVNQLREELDYAHARIAQLGGP